MARVNKPACITLAFVGSKPTAVTVEGKPDPTRNGWAVTALKAVMPEMERTILEALDSASQVLVLVGGNAGPELAAAAAAAKLAAAGKPVTLKVLLPFHTKNVTRQGRTESKGWDAYWDADTRAWFQAILKSAHTVEAVVQHAADSKEGDAAQAERNARIAQFADHLVAVVSPTDDAAAAVVGRVALAGRPITNHWERYQVFYPAAPKAQPKADAPATSSTNPWD